MEFFIRTLLCAARILAASSPVSADDAASEIWADCRAPNACKIEYDHLANQDTDPFLFLGKVVDREHPRWRDYRRSLRNYRDVRDCLVGDQQGRAEPNLLMIDWDRVGTGDNASVCVFRIAASLGSVERIQSWLAFQKFSFSSLSRMVSEKFVPRYETYPIYNITASWGIERYRDINPSWFVTITGFELVKSYTIVLNFDENKRIAGVWVGVRSTLN